MSIHFRTSWAAALLASMFGLAASHTVSGAIYSPTQTELGLVEFTDFWPGNGAALTSKLPVANGGMQYTFNTGFASPTPDAYSRTQFEAPFTGNLTGLEGFSIDFQQNTSANGSQLQAQVYLRYTGGSGFANSGAVSISPTGRTTASVNLSTIPAAALSQVTAFGIEIFALDPFEVDTGSVVTAYTSPQPPSYVDGYQISNFEGTDPAPWGPSFQPDHVHTVVATDGSDFNNGVTKGTHALQIARTYTGQSFPVGGTNMNFRWGSEMALNASAGGGAPQGDYNNNGSVDAADYTVWRNNLGSTSANLPNDATPPAVDQSDFTVWKNKFGQTGGGTDPVVQGKINALVDAINAAAPTGRLAFDVSLLNADAFPDANPNFLGFEMFINDGSGGFYQTNFGFPTLPAIGEFYKGVTLAVPLSAFKDQSSNAFGNLGTALLQKHANFSIGLASNTDANATFVIDNIRVQTLAPGAGALAAVPEPGALALSLLGIICTLGARRRQK